MPFTVPAIISYFSLNCKNREIACSKHLICPVELANELSAFLAAGSYTCHQIGDQMTLYPPAAAVCAALGRGIDPGDFHCAAGGF